MICKETIDKNNKIIQGFIEEFSLNKQPIPVTFRELLPEIKSSDRYTHQIHSYPAKLLAHIPYLFVNNTIFSQEKDYILDPFNGSGTVMLEGLLANRNTLGADANPLARLIAEVKVSKLNKEELINLSNDIISKAKKYKKAKHPDVIHCEFWFPQKTIESLSKLLVAINKIKNEANKKFMLVCFSNCIKKVSYADPRISVPVKLNPDRYEDNSKEKQKVIDRIKNLENCNVYEKFHLIVLENIKRSEELNKVIKVDSIAKVISSDARRITTSLNSNKLLPDSSVQLIITSPPYAGAQKYIRASSLNLGWTELAHVNELHDLDSKNIGRENYKKSEINITKTGIKDADLLISKINKIKPERANIVCTYLHEMKDAIDEMIRVLKTNGYLVLIVGNNKVCNSEFNTQHYLTEYVINQGLKLKFKLIDDIRSYGLMTKRNKTADVISREWILVFEK